MMNEIDSYKAGEYISRGLYVEAIQCILDGSGDLHTAALLAIAGELRNLRQVGISVMAYPNRASKKEDERWS